MAAFENQKLNVQRWKVVTAHFEIRTATKTTQTFASPMEAFSSLVGAGPSDPGLKASWSRRRGTELMSCVQTKA